MQGTFIISDFEPFTIEIIKQLSIPEQQIISLPKNLDEEHKYHDWISEKFKEFSDLRKIIIPLNLDTNDPINDALIIALHIRLNYELTIFQRVIPIIFLSDFTIENIISNNNFDSNNNPQNLLFSQSVYLSDFDCIKIKNVISKAVPIKESDYQNKILDKLKIKEKASVGKHSIANAWGCFKLAQVTGLREQIFKHESISAQLKTLFAKYLICYNDAYNIDKHIDLNPIKCSGKKILFIDDQSDDGWAIIMKKIFTSARDNFVFIDSSKYKNSDTKLFHNFKGFYTACKNEIDKEWDLIIIDLRLNPEQEDIDNEMISPNDFSGYKLVDEFLNYNAGYQIIISTASNKIWNINAVLERGASSYYIKESPVFNYSVSETKKQYGVFKENVKKCLHRDYLRKIYHDIKDLKVKITKLSYPHSFLYELKNQLDLSYVMLSNAKSKEQFAYSFVSLYLIIETINNHFISDILDNSVKKWNISDIGPLLDWSSSWNKGNKEYSNTNSEWVNNKPPEWVKFAGLYFQKWSKKDNAFIENVQSLIKKRNGFVHNNKGILDSKNRSNQYLNRDIYTPDGFIKLFESIKKIINLL